MQTMTEQHQAGDCWDINCLVDALSCSPHIVCRVSQEAAAWLAELGLLRLLGAWLRVLRILPPASTAAEVRHHLRAWRS